jgi:hypothetical protein
MEPLDESDKPPLVMPGADAKKRKPSKWLVEDAIRQLELLEGEQRTLRAIIRDAILDGDRSDVVENLKKQLDDLRLDIAERKRIIQSYNE